MGILASMVMSLSTFYPESHDPNRGTQEVDLSIHRLIAKLPTLAAMSYKNSMRHHYMFVQCFPFFSPDCLITSIIFDLL